MKLYVGNLPWSVKQDDLVQLFGQVGQISDAVVITDRNTGRSRGFGFVEFASDQEAQAAIEKFNGYELDGRKLTVNEARARQDNGGRNHFRR